MKKIVGYERYSVTECGRVWSHKSNKFLRPGLGGGGRYKSICLSVNGKPKGFLIHRLVALTYIDNPLGKPEVNHMDGNTTNNHVDNLEWVTRQENVDHAVKSGLMSSNGCKKTYFKKGFDPRRKMKNKLNSKQVRDIRHRNINGETYRSISFDYDVDESSIRRCCKRQTYADIM